MDHECRLDTLVILALFFVWVTIIDGLNSAIFLMGLEPLNLGYVFEFDVHAVFLLFMWLFYFFAFCYCVLQRNKTFEGDLNLIVPLESLGRFLVSKEIGRGICNRGHFFIIEITKGVGLAFLAARVIWIRASFALLRLTRVWLLSSSSLLDILAVKVWEQWHILLRSIWHLLDGTGREFAHFAKNLLHALVGQ